MTLNLYDRFSDKLLVGYVRYLKTVPVSCMYLDILTHTNTHTHMHTHTHTHTLTYMHTHTRTHTHTHKHTYIHTLSHTHTHAHTLLITDICGYLMCKLSANSLLKNA